MFHRFESESEVPSVLSSLAASFTRAEQYDKLKMYADELEKPSSTINKALENCEYNLLWAAANVPNITNYVKQFVAEDEEDSSAMSLSISFTTLIVSYSLFYL